MGYYLGLSKIAFYNNNKFLMRKNMTLSLLLPVLMHTFYDFCLFANNIILLIFLLIFVIYIYIFLYKRVKHVSRNAKDFLIMNNFCKKCGYKVFGNYCPVCGNCHN